MTELHASTLFRTRVALHVISSVAIEIAGTIGDAKTDKYDIIH